MRQKGFSPVIIVIIVIVFILLGAGGYFAYSKGYINLAPSKSPPASSSASPTANLSPTEVPVSSPTSASSKIYLLKLKLKSDSSIPGVGPVAQSEFLRLTDYVASILKLPEKSVTQLLYDTRITAPYQPENAQFNSTFYTLLNQAAVLSSSYEDQFVTASVQSVDDAFLPYLIKSDYCEKDSDCSLGADMCTQGAFNYYKKYVDPPWGCGPGGYKSTYSWFTWGERDATLNCDVELKFDGAKCINNQCAETGFKKVCIE